MRTSLKSDSAKTAKSVTPVAKKPTKTAESFSPNAAKSPVTSKTQEEEKEKDVVSDAEPDSGLRSIRIKDLDVGTGEALQECSSEEWDKSESAYDAELLNVKKKKNKVTVFAAPEKSVEVQNHLIRQTVMVPAEKEKKSAEVEDPASSLARMVEGIARELLTNRKATVGVEVSVSLKIVGEEESKNLTLK